MTVKGGAIDWNQTHCTHAIRCRVGLHLFMGALARLREPHISGSERQVELDIFGLWFGMVSTETAPRVHHVLS